MIIVFKTVDRQTLRKWFHDYLFRVIGPRMYNIVILKNFRFNYDIASLQP